MKLLAFSVFDTKTDAFARPFFCKSIGEAMRSWESISNDPQSEICKFPADFTLFQVGEFDETTGKLTPLDAAKNLGTALQAKARPADQLPMFPEGRRDSAASSVRNA